jgi:hypothetical protein
MTTEATHNDHAIVRVAEDGIYYRASALGGCFRALWAARNSYEPKSPPDHMQTIFDRGHEIEDLVLDQLVADGWTIYDRQREVIIPVDIPSDIPIFIVGHIDALGIPPVGVSSDPEANLFPHVVEVKGFGPDYYAKYLREGINGFPRYSVQAGAYCIGIPCGDLAFVVYEKETEAIHVSFHENKIPEWHLSAIVLAVEEMTRKNEIPTCTNDYPCPYYYLHDPKEMPMPLDPLASTLVQSIVNIDEQAKLLKSARDICMNQLKDAINWVEGQPLSYDSESGVVNVSMNPVGWDNKKIAQLLTDAELDADDYRTKSSGWHLRIVPKKSHAV